MKKLILLAALVLTGCSPVERGVYFLAYDLELETECKRLGSCLQDQDTRINAYAQTSENRCLVTKGNFERRYRIPELRGALRTCELLTGKEDKGLY